MSVYIVVQTTSVANSANAASRLGSFASLMGANADSNPPKRKAMSTVAFSHELLPTCRVSGETAAGRDAIIAPPAIITTKRGRILATVKTLFAVVPWRTPRTLINAVSPTRTVRIRKRGQGSFTAGQNSAR